MQADHFYSRQSERLDLYKQYAGKLLAVRRIESPRIMVLLHDFRLAMPTDAFVLRMYSQRHVEDWPEQVPVRHTTDDACI